MDIFFAQVYAIFVTGAQMQTENYPLLISRLHFEKLKNVPVLQLDASVDFQNDPDIREQFIQKVL